MPKVVLVNPSVSTVGYSFITPRWLFVIAQATPAGLVGDPVMFDETIVRFNPDMVDRGDIVGVGINTGNCFRGYQVLKEAKARGATVILGGVHATLFPEEALEMGADAVVGGNGDLAWGKAIRDALEGRLAKRYDGGRVPGELLLKARWDLLDPAKYGFPSIQTVAGCPENCSFCSVWVTEGRQPRQRLSNKIIEEVNELYRLGFRWILFADDNFTPCTLGRIAREPSEKRRKELERIREERLQFFEEYDRSVPRGVYAFTQMTSEVVSDPEYLAALHDKVRIRGALIGVESFSEEGLKSAGKQWNPAGQKMVEAIRKIQEQDIGVLSSIIVGLESDEVATLRTMRHFARESGTLLAQFTFYVPFPGSKDFYEMMADRRNLGKPGFVPKHKTQVLHDRYWLEGVPPYEIIRHPHLSPGTLLAENQKCWQSFYSLGESVRRAKQGPAGKMRFAGKVAYVLLGLAFRRFYGGYGVSADSVRRSRAGPVTRMLFKGVAMVLGYIRNRQKMEMERSPVSAADGAQSPPAGN
jgi:radical SAM superfamily enzyme YgiQ (UPF0313 family)